MAEAKKDKLILPLSSTVLKELTDIAQKVGFTDAQSLLLNYVREVLLAARIEQATGQLRTTVVRGSADLDQLLPPPQKSSK